MDNTSQNQHAKRIILPYVQGVAEEIGGILRREGVQTAFKTYTRLIESSPFQKTDKMIHKQNEK